MVLALAKNLERPGFQLSRSLRGECRLSLPPRVAPPTLS